MARRTMIGYRETFPQSRREEIIIAYVLCHDAENVQVTRRFDRRVSGLH